jgi:hypothetical protein
MQRVAAAQKFILKNSNQAVQKGLRCQARRIVIRVVVRVPKTSTSTCHEQRKLTAIFAGENDALRPDNRRFWKESLAGTAT